MTPAASNAAGELVRARFEGPVRHACGMISPRRPEPMSHFAGSDGFYPSKAPDRPASRRTRP